VKCGFKGADARLRWTTSSGPTLPASSGLGSSDEGVGVRVGVWLLTMLASDDR
jgi:hypothetical protein